MEGLICVYLSPSLDRTLEERAKRLFSTKGVSMESLDPALFARSKHPQVSPLPLSLPHCPGRMGHVPWIPGNVPWMAGNVPWTAGNVPWTAGNVPWTAGNVPWMARIVPWTPGNVLRTISLSFPPPPSPSLPPPSLTSLPPSLYHRGSLRRSSGRLPS